MTGRCSRPSLRYWVLVLVATALVLPLRAAPGELEQNIAEVAERVKPAVVSITADRDAAERPRAEQPPGRTPLARGSGMIYRETDKYYYILTNAHVVRGAASKHVQVQIIAEREERDGTVLATDTRNDVAVVRIDRRPEDKLQLVRIGKVADVRTGNFVLAVGSPFGFEWSVSFGIVSGVDRELREPMTPDAQARPFTFRGLIQTDASINPGNSGGPLVNLRGEVVGINFAIYAPGVAGNIGLGFAIPIDRAVRSAEDIIAFGRVKRAYLGVLVSDLDRVARDQKTTLAELRKLIGVDYGAFIHSVTAGTPAAKAGLEPGDVIVALNGEKVETSGTLVDKVTAVPPGTDVTVEFIRSGEKLTTKMAVVEMPAEATGPERPDQPKQPARDPLGLKVTELTADKAKELGVDAKGVLVAEAAPNSLAAANGLMPGTVLLKGRAEGGTAVFDSVEAYTAFMTKAARAAATVQLWFSAVPERPGGPRTIRSILLKVPKAEEGE